MEEGGRASLKGDVCNCATDDGREHTARLWHNILPSPILNSLSNHLAGIISADRCGGLVTTTSKISSHRIDPLLPTSFQW